MMSRQNNNSPVPQEVEGLIQNIDIVNNNNDNEVANQETVSHAFSAE